MYYMDLQEFQWHRVNYDEQRSVALPTPRAAHTMVYFEINRSLYIFGGGNSHQMFNDLFVFDLDSNSWLMPSIGGEFPSPRAGHSATKIDEKYFCIFGGGDLTTVFNDTFLFNIENNTWIKVKPIGEQPPKRCGHTATRVNQSKILIFGGGDVDGELFSDLYSLDISQMVSVQKSIKKTAAAQQVASNQSLNSRIDQNSQTRAARRRAITKEY